MVRSITVRIIQDFIFMVNVVHHKLRQDIDVLEPMECINAALANPDCNSSDIA